MYYFAYGSNMNQNRMLARDVIFSNVERGILENYKFIINKRSKKDPKIGFANIEYCNGSKVEGVLYEIESIEQLDKFEGYPLHYNRVILPIQTNTDIIVNAFCYIANIEWISDGLKVSDDYKYHILEGKKYMSVKYYNKLNNIL